MQKQRMVQMKKVGLVTCYFHPNYGSMLQAYATQKILDDWQIPCENIAIDGLRQGIDRAKTRFYLKQWHKGAGSSRVTTVSRVTRAYSNRWSDICLICRAFASILVR